jgi:hypothetical protein
MTKTKTTRKTVRKTVRPAPVSNGKVETGAKLTLLRAAALVLRGRKAPLSAREIYDLVVARGLWATREGKTPVDSLKAQIAVAIARSGGRSTFVRTSPGRFLCRKSR